MTNAEINKLFLLSNDVEYTGLTNGLLTYSYEPMEGYEAEIIVGKEHFSVRLYKEMDGDLASYRMFVAEFKVGFDEYLSHRIYTGF